MVVSHLGLQTLALVPLHILLENNPANISISFGRHHLKRNAFFKNVERLVERELRSGRRALDYAPLLTWANSLNRRFMTEIN